MRRTGVRAVCAMALLLSACTGSAPTATTPSTRSNAQLSSSAAGPGPRLAGAAPCPNAPTFTCSSLTVPLDWSHRTTGTLSLRVAVESASRAHRGILLLLTGGPGQPGVPFAGSFATRLAPLKTAYRVVMLDQRGTGSAALQCPQLQQELGSSDLTAPAVVAVERCAATLGSKRQFFGTADTIADLDDLRAALGAPTMTIDGVSYGSYVAERYTIRYPARVSRLVLDSVVPDRGPEPLFATPMHAVARVLRSVCRTRECPGDPVADLAAVLAGPSARPSDLLDALTVAGIVDPSYPGVPEMLHAAAAGDRAALDRFVEAVHRGSAATAEQLSQGLHASTLCADLDWPWSSPGASPTQRRSALALAAAPRIPPSALYPFDRSSAVNNGVATTCVHWPGASGHSPDRAAAARPYLAPRRRP